MLLKIRGPRQRRVTADALFRGSMDLDLVPDSNTHQVFADFQRSGISFSGLRYQVGSIRRHNVRIDRQPGLYLAENGSCLFGGGVVRDYFLRQLRVEDSVAPAKRFGIDHLVNQHIRALSEVDQILAVAGIAGEHHGVPAIIDAVAERRFDGRVVHSESSYLQIAILINHPLLDVFGRHDYARSGKHLIDITSHMDIELVGLLQVRHHVRCARRSPDAERRAPAQDPAGQIKVRNSDNVIGVQVSQKQGVEVIEWDLELIEAHGSATPAIEQQLFLSRLHQDAGAETLHHRAGSARAQKCDFEILRSCGQAKSDDRNQEQDGLRPEPFAWVHKFTREKIRLAWERAC